MPSRRHKPPLKHISDLVAPIQPSNSVSSSLTQAQIELDLTYSPPNWPQDIRYLTSPVLSAYLPLSHLKWLYRKAQSQSKAIPASNPNDTAASSTDHDNLPVIKLPIPQNETSSRVQIRTIEHKGHPAKGQRGLFAARDLKPGDLIVPYFGYVHSSTETESKEHERQITNESQVVHANANGDKTTASENTANPAMTTVSATGTDGSTSVGRWDTSSYDLNIHRSDSIELAIDAQDMGNEARFINDYRGVPAQRPPDDTTDPQRNERMRRMAKRRVKGWNDNHVKDKDKDVILTQENGRDRDRDRDQEVIKVLDRTSNGHDYNGDDHSDDHSYHYNHNYSYNHDQEFAIPNAEFRDVWFELPPIAGTTDVQGTVDTNIGYNNSDINPNDKSIGNLTLHDLEQTIVPSQSSTPRLHRKPKPKPKPNRIRGIAIFVLPAGKAGKRKHGIRMGQEILVSYGKGFWAHHS